MLDTILVALTKVDIKIDTVAIDLNLLRADKKRVADRVKQVESEVTTLQRQTTDL